MKRISESEKISLAECRRILNREGSNYTDEQIKLIRDWLYQFTENLFAFVQSKNNEQVITIKEKIRNKNNKP